MKRLKTVRFFQRDNNSDQREPTILDHGDPVTVRLTRELEERKRRMSLSATHPLGL